MLLLSAGAVLLFLRGVGCSVMTTNSTFTPLFKRIAHQEPLSLLDLSLFTWTLKGICYISNALSPVQGCADRGKLWITTSLRGRHSSLVICRKCNNYILFFQPHSVDQLRVLEGIVVPLEEFAFLSRSHWEAYYSSCVCLLNLKLHPGDSQSSLGQHKDWKWRKTASRVLTEGRKIDLPAHLKLIK